MCSRSKRLAAAATGSLPDVRRGYYWLIGFASLMLLAVLAIWQVPQWLDWTRYRDTIEVLATTMLGRPVAIQGPIALTVLPEPLLTATQVDIGTGSPADVSVHVKALRLRVALWPLLAGHIEARDLVLRGADVRIPWPAEARVLRAHPPAWLGAFSARIEEGSFSIGRVGISGIDATLRSSDTGAFAAAGSAQFNGKDWRFVARLTSPGADEAVGLDATLDAQGKAAGLGASVTGQLSAEGGFNGSISSHGPDLSMLVPAPPVAFRADGRLTIGGGLAIADNLVLQIGGSPATGAIALRVAPMQRLDIALSASRLDLDTWLPVLLDASNSVAGVDLPIGVDLSANAAPLGGDLLENVRAAFELSDQALVLREGSALLPGNGRLRLSGAMKHGDAARPEFVGAAHLDAPVLRTTLQWLRKAAPGWLADTALSYLPDGVLQHATLTTRVSADRDAVLLRAVTGDVDASSIAGSLGFRRGAVPTFSADLTVDHASLDDWAPASGQVPQSVDADVRLNIRAAALRGYTLRDVGLDGSVTGGVLTLRQLGATLNGLQMSASGKVGKDQQVSDGKLNLISRDATPLGAMLPGIWQATPALWHGPLRLSLQAAGALRALGVTMHLTLDDARLDATPTIDLTSGAWNGELTVRHPSARRLIAALGLPDRTGLPELPDWLGDGSLSLVAHLHGAPNQIAADSLDMTAGGLRFGGEFALDQSSNQPHLHGQLHADNVPVPVPSAASSVPLPIGLVRGWQGDVALTAGRLIFGDEAVRDVSASISVADGALRVERLTGKLGGGTLSGTSLFNSLASPPTLAVQARLDGATVAEPLGMTPIDLVDGDVQGSVDLTASGYSPATLISTLAGRLSLTVTDGAVAGFDLSGARRAAQQADAVAAQHTATDALNGGTTRFDKLELGGTLTHGSVSLDAVQLLGGAGEVSAGGDANLPGKELNLHIVLRPAMQNPPEIGVQLTGPFNHPQRTLDLANLARFVAERAH
jgi:uncharacterized protein involved in outer membrane biogenesis